MKASLAACSRSTKDCGKCKKNVNNCSCKNTWHFDRCARCNKDKCVCRPRFPRCEICNEQEHNCRCKTHCKECKRINKDCKCCDKCLKYECCCEVVIINSSSNQEENVCLECEKVCCICCKKCHRLECVCRLTNCRKCKKSPHLCECVSPKLCLECEHPKERCECCKRCKRGICKCPKKEGCRECGMEKNYCICCKSCYRKECICHFERCEDCNYPLNECNCHEKKTVPCPIQDRRSSKPCPEVRNKHSKSDLLLDPTYLDKIHVIDKNIVRFNLTGDNITSGRDNSSARSIKLSLDLRFPRPLHCDKTIGYFNISFQDNNVPCSGVIKYCTKEKCFLLLGSIGAVGESSIGIPTNGQLYAEGMYLIK
jgi:hypothetical protein